MVYRGKPSQSCAGCRSRRIKCDLLRPECSQCMRDGRECIGYRDQADLMFEDQTQHVVKRAEALYHTAKPHTTVVHQPRKKSAGSRDQDGNSNVLKQKKQSEKARNSNRAVVVRNKAISPPPVITHVELMQPVEEMAACFFMANYVFVKEESRDVQLAMALNKLRYKQTQAELTKSDAMTVGAIAVGLAALSTSTNNPRFRINARVMYQKALQLTVAALNDPAEVKSTRSLRAVLLLATFESALGVESSEILSWEDYSFHRHIEGVSALISTRGIEGMKDPPAFELFIQTRFFLIIGCLDKRRRVPESIKELSIASKNMQSPGQWLVSQLALIMIRFVEFWVTIPTTGEIDHHIVISTLMEIDSELQAWQASVPSMWGYKVEVITPHNPAIYGGEYHTYLALEIAATWNFYRWIRIVINEKLLASIHAIPDCPASLLLRGQRCTEITRVCVDELCKSAPFCAYGTPESCDKTPKNPPARGSGAMVILRPLYIAGSTRSAAPDVCPWVIGFLYSMGVQRGLHLAIAIAKKLEAERQMQSPLPIKFELPLSPVSLSPVSLSSLPIRLTELD